MTDTLATLTVADVERQKLQKHFGRFDILFFLVCTIVGVDTIATVAQGGGEAFTWMMIFAVVFFIPQALLFAELGTAFPQEGGPYYWTRLAFGHLAGAVNNFLYGSQTRVARWDARHLRGGAGEVFFNHGDSLATAAFYIFTLASSGCPSGDHLLQRGEVGAHGRRHGPVPPARLLHMSVMVFAAKHGVHGSARGLPAEATSGSSASSASCCSTSSASSCPTVRVRR